jgi:hydrogenase maturation factor
MCYAIPGKVIEIRGDSVIVDYSGEKKVAKTIFKVEKGEYVYVSGKIIIEKIPKKQAIKAINTINSVKNEF